MRMAKTTAWVLCGVGAAWLLTGCGTTKRGHVFTACCDNVDQEVPILTCQPLDVSVRAGGRAVFYTEAQGKNLRYQWYFIGGGESAEPQELASANQPVLEIPSVGPTHYGLYSCAVEGEPPRRGITHSRLASLGGPIIGGGSGTFATMQNPVQGGGSTTVCNPPRTVSTKKVAFGSQTPNAPPATPPDNGFRGNVSKVVGGNTTLISSGDYYLQFYYTSTQNVCCDPVAGSTTQEVQCGLMPGYPYTITVFFKQNKAPPTGTTVILNGTWINIP